MVIDQLFIFIMFYNKELGDINIMSGGCDNP